MRQPSATDSKADLRRDLRRRRRARSVHTPWVLRDSRAAKAVLSNPLVESVLHPGCSVAVYVALPHEPPTSWLRRELRYCGMSVFVPWTQPERNLVWVRDDGQSRAWGVPGEPAQPISGLARSIADLDDLRLLVIPALAATPAGERLGQGGGYYDTLLAGVAPFDQGGPLRVALVGSDEVFDALPTDAHDQLVDLVLPV